MNGNQELKTQNLVRNANHTNSEAQSTIGIWVHYKVLQMKLEQRSHIIMIQLQRRANQMETQSNTTNWLEVEAGTLNTNSNFEKLPALKFLEENKIEEITIDFSKPFDKYTDTSNPKKSVVKAIIPVMHNGIKCVWWLNKKNPTYKLIIDAGKKGITTFKITRTGSQQDTKYNILK